MLSQPKSQQRLPRVVRIRITISYGEACTVPSEKAEASDFCHVAGPQSRSKTLILGRSSGSTVTDSITSGLSQTVLIGSGASSYGAGWGTHNIYDLYLDLLG